MGKKIKCGFCNKKCGLIFITCKSCNMILCNTHMSLSSHECKNIDKKKDEVKNELNEKNPKMNSMKVEKI